MPGDSIWKQPIVRPWRSSVAVRGSRSGNFSKSTRMPRSSSTFFAASDTMDSERCPSRSILTRPVISMPPISYCVTTMPLALSSSAVYQVSGRSPITSPPRWMLRWRT